MREITPINELHSMVRGVLVSPERYEWTIQGFGMLRTKIGDDMCRLNIWDDRYALPIYKACSSIHDHPWDFTSTVVCGTLRNTIYTPTMNPRTPEFQGVLIRPGEGGGALSEPFKQHLIADTGGEYFPGDSYGQEAWQLHSSACMRGTVTVNTRTRTTPRDEAHVYWKQGPWQSAEPRPATFSEIEAITRNSLISWWEGQ